MEADRVRRWIANFEAVAEAERQELRQRGPNPRWSIALALSMIEAAESAGQAPAMTAPQRAAEDEHVRDTWARLREGLAR